MDLTEWYSARRQRTGIKVAHREDAITFTSITVHLYVVITPFLNLLYGKWCLHEPSEH